MKKRAFILTVMALVLATMLLGVPGLGALPAAAVARSIAGQRYYYDGSAYYQPCYQGTDVSYCVVADPNQ